MAVLCHERVALWTIIHISSAFNRTYKRDTEHDLRREIHLIRDKTNYSKVCN